MFYDSQSWLRDRPGYHNIEQSDFDRPERWEGDIEISSVGPFIFENGRHRKVVNHG